MFVMEVAVSRWAILGPYDLTGPLRRSLVLLAPQNLRAGRASGIAIAAAGAPSTASAENSSAAFHKDFALICDVVISMAPKKTTRRRVGKEACFINSLPRELIEQVFLRLPASNLLRCISVCKMWREIIRDSQFAMVHLQHAPSCTLLFSPKGATASKGSYPSDAIIFDEAWSPSTWAVPVIGPDDLICGSCNGLLCLHTPASTIKIANLATGEHLHLKKPTRFLKDDHFSFYRFGFHPATKGYKVIHFFQERGLNATGRCDVIQVYTLGDEKWKDVASPQSLSLSCVTNSGVVIVDGTMYWLTEDSGANWQHVVMSFDLGEDTFMQIQLPAFGLEHGVFGAPHRFWVAEIEGKVCVSTAQSLDRELICDLQVWALNKPADQRWIQIYNIQFSSLFARGPHFVQGDKIVIQARDNSLYSYKLPGKKFEIELSKMDKLVNLSPRGQVDMQFYSYVKSIVPLDLYAKAAIVHSPKRKEGWRLKKWKSWEHGLSMIEKMWRIIHQEEHEMMEKTQLVAREATKVSQYFPDELIRQRVCIEIDQILQHLPVNSDQHTNPLRRLNWVEMWRNLEKLKAHIDISNDIIKAQLDIVKILESYWAYIKGLLENSCLWNVNQRFLVFRAPC
ncbi:hypothetical protein EJB05_43447, partial [Eragrostis curvula]